MVLSVMPPTLGGAGGSCDDPPAGSAQRCGGLLRIPGSWKNGQQEGKDDRAAGAGLLLILGTAAARRDNRALPLRDGKRGKETNNQPQFRGDDSSGMGNHLIHATRNTGIYVNETNRYVVFSGNNPSSRVPRTGAVNTFHLTRITLTSPETRWACR